ncbi:MAG: ABC transporter substrate-binding protein [Planctomycetaceae bacterium]|nr:ABC transporter substrate-binding protein [Planctomycetaceae bacterium]
MLIRSLRLRAKSLLLHPLRSLLTILGIFIGVASVIWLLAISEGISRAAQKQIEDLGVTNIILRSVLPANDDLEDTTFYIPYGITRQDYATLVGTIPTVSYALRIREAYREAHYRDKTLQVRLVGCTPEYARVMHLSPSRGHFLSTIDVENDDNVCVLGAGTARIFFPLENPVGKTIRIRDIPYHVIGVMRARLPMAGIGGSLAAQDFSQDLYIPVTTFWRRIGDRTLTISAGQRNGQEIQLSQITFQVASVKDVLPTAKAIESTMKRLHDVPDYAVVTPLELLEQSRTTRLMFMIFMGLIALISLLVGGIGIMNIMLATVTERTREIGVRRALGATRSDITRHFLIEVTLLTSVGGAFGVLGGIGCPFLIVELRELLVEGFPQLAQGLPEVIQTATPIVLPWSIALAFGVSVVIGVVFGLYPAMRAAALDPIEALRHD